MGVELGVDSLMLMLVLVLMYRYIRRFVLMCAVAELLYIILSYFYINFIFVIKP